MPANLSPDYKSAEAAFKNARDAKERLDCLREMLRTIPKHKGTEHLQADIKTRIKHLTEELAGPKKGGGRRGPIQVIRAEGAAQIALIGAPNVGKSTLHARLTGSHAEVGPYPYTTHAPLPGMLPHQDIHFQLIDLPPVSSDRPLPWIGNALQPADGCMLLVDLQDPSCLDQVEAIRGYLSEKRITLTERWEDKQTESSESDSDADFGDPFALLLPTLLVASKVDQTARQQEELDVFQELLDIRYPALSVSATSGEGLDRIGPWLFQALQIIRVYTKTPGKPADKDRPFTVRRGNTVLDVALLVHREFEQTLKYARLWGHGQFDGQQVSRDHPVCDGDILELHA